MSNTQFAFMMESRVPSRDALQASIDALGFDLKLDPALKLLENAGFSPCVLGGVPEVGFELFSTPAAEVVEEEEELAAIAGSNDVCLSLIWHGSMKDCACVMIVSCALARDFGAVISYEGEEPEGLDALLEGARAALMEAANQS